MYNGIFYMKILIGRMMLGVAVACLLAGCALGGRPSGSARQSHDRDGVVVAISSEPATLDPVKGWGHGNTPLIQSTLIKYDSDMGFEKDLAVSYQLDESGLVWTFTLRGDARFTDGETVTASDVSFTF